MLPIAKAALKEAVRKKTFIVMSIVTALYLILWAVILYYFTNSVIEDEAGRIIPLATVMITQMGLQFSSMLMCLLTIILGAGAIAAELDNGMIHAILSRPIGRTEYVLGKYVGLAVLTAAYAALLYAALLLIGGLFSLSTIVSLDVSQIVCGGLLYLLVPLAVLCLTLYGSVSLKAVQNGLLMIFIYILGNIGGMVEMIGNVVGSKPVLSAGIFISLISPFHNALRRGRKEPAAHGGISRRNAARSRRAIRQRPAGQRRDVHLYRDLRAWLSCAGCPQI